MSVGTALTSFFRTQWADRLTENCLIERVDTETLNTTTGVVATSWTTVQAVSCLIRPAAPTDVQAGQRQTELRMYDVFVPYDVTNVRPDDRVTITTSQDGQMNTAAYTVRNIQTDTYHHRRQLNCEEVVGG